MPRRLSDIALALLLTMAALAALEGIVINDRPDTSGFGGDFSQFHTAGTIVARGETARLYDQPYFRQIQKWMREDPLHSLYPPSMALAMAPLGRLSYFHALAVWWALQALCIIATGTILYCTSPLQRPWRGIMLAALAALLPLWIAVGIGHLAPMLLLVLTAGLTLHRNSRPIVAGVLLSLLAVKPQLAAGLGVWMLLRGDLRTIFGLVFGAFLQFAIVSAALGPQVWLDYLHALPAIVAVTRAYRYSPLFEQSLTGIASNLLYDAGLGGWVAPAMKAVYALSASAAVFALWRVVTARNVCRRMDLRVRPLQADGLGGPSYERAACGDRYEYAAGVLFMTILPPYFLVYDQTLLAFALAMLFATPRWRWGVLLLIVSAVPVANLSFTFGFSFTAIVALGTMIALTRRSPASEGESAFSCGRELVT